LNITTFTRRSFVFGSLGLAGCQSTGDQFLMSRATTSAYDGNYTLLVESIQNDTAWVRRDGRVGERRILAELLLKSEEGILTIVSVSNYMGAGPDFDDFMGEILASNKIRLLFTTNYLFSKQQTYYLNFEIPISNVLLSGGWVEVMPNGYDDNNDAVLRIKRNS
jgi:hypothetical protein